MITSSQRPSRYSFRKLLTIPALLAVMVFSCSKEQNVLQEEPKAGPPVSVRIVGDMTVNVDSVRLGPNSALRDLIWQKVRYYTKDAELKEVNISIDTSLVITEPMQLARVIPDSRPE